MNTADCGKCLSNPIIGPHWRTRLEDILRFLQLNPNATSKEVALAVGLRSATTYLNVLKRLGYVKNHYEKNAKNGGPLARWSKA